MESVSGVSGAEQSARSAGMAAERAPVKEEPEWGARGESAAAAAEGLYAGHEVKEELVLGPELIQMQDIAYLMQGALNTTEEDPFQLKPAGGAGAAPERARARPGERPRCNTSHQQQLQLSSCFVRLERFPIEHLRRNLHTCETCLMTFDCKSSLRNHRCINAAEESNFIKVCDETKIHFECDVCGKEFVKKRHIIRHLAAHNVEQSGEKKIPYSDYDKFADTTDSVFETRMKNQSASSVHTAATPGPLAGEKLHSCNICQRKLTSKSSLTRHIRIHTGEKLISCDKCKKQFTCISHLTVHRRIHTGEKPFACDVCKKQFSHSSNFSQHRRTHTGEKPYCCRVCNKRFAQKSNLTRHMHTHTGDKLYSCDICQKKFTQSSNVTKHMRIHTGEKPFACNVCQKQFKSSGGLTDHRRTHTGEKPYCCRVCNKRFAQQSPLTRHMHTHTGDKLYSCEICKKKFTERRNVTMHMRIHTGEKPFACDVCHKQFRHKSTLTTHMRIHSGE